MDALKVYDVKKICDARLCIVDMAAAFVRALVTVLMMGGVAVLYRYRAVPAARLSSCSLHPRAAARLPSCSLHPRAAARPLAVRAASLRLGASARSPARPCRRPRAPQLPACRRGALQPPSGTAASRMSKGCPAAALGHHSRPHIEGAPCHPPSSTAAARMPKGCPATRPGLVPALAPVLAVGLAIHIQNRRDQTVPAIHRRGGGI